MSTLVESTVGESTLVEMGALIRSRPGVDAPPPVVAGWYEQKATVLGHIAAETGDRQTREWARQAHTRAQRLRAETAQRAGRGQAARLVG